MEEFTFEIDDLHDRGNGWYGHVMWVKGTKSDFQRNLRTLKTKLFECLNKFCEENNIQEIEYLQFITKNIDDKVHTLGIKWHIVKQD